MQISLTARHFEVTPGLRQFTAQRLEKLQKFATDIHGVHVIVIQERSRFEAEITMRVNGSQLVCTESHSEAGAAIELAANRLEERLRRLKERRSDHKSHKPGTPGATAESANDAGDDEFADEE